MADKIRYSINVTPLEEVEENFGYTSGTEDVDILTDHDSTHVSGDGVRNVDVIATEAQRTYGSNGSVDLTTQFGTIADSVNGFSLGKQTYREAPHTNNTTNISTESSAKFVHIKNTGFQSIGNNSTTYGPALNASLRVMDGTSVISCLSPDESIVLKGLPNATIDCNSIHVRSCDPNGSIGTPGALAVEFLVAK